MTIQQLFEAGERKIPKFTMTDRLRKAREAAGMTQGQLGAQMGSNHKIVGNIERGTTPIDGPALILWALICDVDLDWLKTGEEKPSTDPDGPDGGLPNNVTRLPGLDSNQEPIGFLTGRKEKANTSGFQVESDVTPLRKVA